MKETEVNTWKVSLILLCAVLGAMIGLSFKAQEQNRERGLPSGMSLANEYFVQLKKLSDNDQRTIATLQTNIAQLEQELANVHKGSSPAIEAELNQAKFLAGLTGVQGPGIIVTLNDSKKRYPDQPIAIQDLSIVHDTDINQTLNELKAAGAEALSVNNQRIIATSPVRCAGPTIFVNNTPQTPPFQICAIGDPKTLTDALNLPGGVADNLDALDKSMFKMTPSNNLTLPAYTGAFQPRYAQPIPMAVDQK